MNKQPIGVFDSGVGGLTVLERLVKIFPNEDFCYVADKKYCPYGLKTGEEVSVRVRKIVKFMTEKGAKAIVIACNTASLRIDCAKKATSVPVVSVIEPTCKKAISLTKNGKVAVLGTVATINSGIYQKLLRDAGKTPVPLACSEFVDIIENNDISNHVSEKLVKDKLFQIKDTGVDTLVHGCTHFSLLERQMRKVLDDINYVACGAPTGEKLKEIFFEKGLSTASLSKGKVEIYTTGSVENALTTMKRFKSVQTPVTHIDIE